MTTILERLDQTIAGALSEWSLTTTALAILVAAVLIYPLAYPNEPDTHPLLLARQASASAVRIKNESAVYRSPEVPHGYPLRSGLDVKDAGAPRWASGRDGDLRDIWREVQKGGAKNTDGKEVPKGVIMSVFGTQDIEEHDIEVLSKEIGTIGKHLQSVGVKKVAIYLPNSIEYLQTIFACAFYGLSPVLLPFNLPPAKLYKLLNSTATEALIAQAGTVPLDDVAQNVKGLRQLTWVVEKTSKHMDWNGVPSSAQGRLSVSVWHDVIEDPKSGVVLGLPNNEQGDKPGDVIVPWQSTNLDAEPEIVTFTQNNMVAAVGSLLSAIPLRQRLTSADLVLPADTFAHNYVLCQTLAALFTHANLTINSVAAPGVDFHLAQRGVAPTVIISSAETLANLHSKETKGISSSLQKFSKYSQDQTISSGRMPTDGLLFRMLAPSSSGTNPGKLRLILVSERVEAGSPALSSTMLSDLRIFTRSRIIYALTTAKVAGAVAQTNIFDYRRDDGPTHSHFGIPLSSVEIKLSSTSGDNDVAGTVPKGTIVVRGPAVSGGESKLNVKGRFREDSTLAYA